MFQFLLAGLAFFLMPTAHVQAAPIAPVAVVVAAPAPAPEPPSTKELIAEAAARYGVNYAHLYGTLQCESLNFSHNGQSRIPHEGGPNGYEDSWGYAQIHLPDHPDITKKQALNPAWAIDWAAYQFSIGNAWMWSCYNKLYA